jgi:hypothetical protein
MNKEVEMKLVAKKTNEYKGVTGPVWAKVWSLMDEETGRIYGVMTWNMHHGAKCYHVFINNPIHADMGTIFTASYANCKEALEAARTEIESLKEPTAQDISDALERLKDNRYQAEMSDDYFHSNGKAAKFYATEQALRKKLAELL